MECLAKDYRSSNLQGETSVNPATPARFVRRGAVSASTVFAIALAIVAGLIFAWLFKMVIFDRKKPEKPADTSVAVSVTAANIRDKTEISGMHVRTVKMARDDFNRLKADHGGKAPLTGAQAIGRVTKRPLRAEEPIWEEDLLPFEYPPSVASKLAPGKKASIIEVGARDAMVQVDDVVDLYVTMANDAFGAAGNATAVIAKQAKVVARFNTTRPGAQPAKLDAPRTYTLEVSPYRFALIELAKTLGAKFSIGVTNIASESEGTLAASTASEVSEPSPDIVTPAHLATLFGITPPAPTPPPFTLERLDGLRVTGVQSFPNYAPSRSGAGSVTPVSASPSPVGPSVPSTTPPSGGVVPASGRQGAALPAANPVTPAAALDTRNVVAARGQGNSGFRPLSAKSGGCEACGRKR